MLKYYFEWLEKWCKCDVRGFALLMILLLLISKGGMLKLLFFA